MSMISLPQLNISGNWISFMGPQCFKSLNTAAESPKLVNLELKHLCLLLYIRMRAFNYLLYIPFLFLQQLVETLEISWKNCDLLTYCTSKTSALICSLSLDAFCIIQGFWQDRNQIVYADTSWTTYASSSKAHLVHNSTICVPCRSCRSQKKALGKLEASQ